MNLDYWPQVLSIVFSNLGMFLWATRQARSDYLHMDKKFEDNRKEMSSIMDRHLIVIEKNILNNEELLKSFDQRLSSKNK